MLFKIKLDLFELKNGDWVPLTDFNNPWCEVVSLLDQLWRKAKAATQPPIPDGCIIPAVSTILIMTI